MLDSDGKFRYTMAKEFTIDTSQGEFTVSVPAQPADTIRFSVTDNLTDGSIFAGEQTAAQMLEKLALSVDENIFAYNVLNADGTVISEEDYADTAAAGKYIKIKAKDGNVYFV